jgi:uncharacterized tellurite resistance protein B-like protein
VNNTFIGLLLCLISAAIFTTTDDLILGLISWVSFFYGISFIVNGINDNTNEESYESFRNRNKTARRNGRFSFSQNLDYIFRLRQSFLGNDSVNILCAILAAISTHIAKIDGLISGKEISAIREAIDRNFESDVNHSFIAEVVSLTKDHLNRIGHSGILTSIFEVTDLYLELIRQLPGAEKNEFKILLFTMLYEVGIADDGTLSKEEKIIFQGLFNHYGISIEFREVIRRTAEYNYNLRHKTEINSFRNVNKLEEAMKFFGLENSFTREELEKAWKRFALAYHPDKYHNASSDIYELMNRKFLEGKEVYDYLSTIVK